MKQTSARTPAKRGFILLQAIVLLGGTLPTLIAGAQTAKTGFQKGKMAIVCQAITNAKIKHAKLHPETQGTYAELKDLETYIKINGKPITYSQIMAGTGATNFDCGRYPDTHGHIRKEDAANYITEIPGGPGPQ